MSDKRPAQVTPLSVSSIDPEDAPIELADFETAIWETGFGKFNYYIFVSLIPVTLSFVFSTSAMSYIIPVISCEFQLSSFQKGALNGAIYIGMVPFGIFWGFVTDLYGRQNILFYGLLADSAAGICSSLAPNFEIMVVCRVVAGVTMCATYASCYTLLVEFLGQSRRDGGVMLLGCFTSSGNFINPLLAFLLIPITWVYPVSDSYIITSWRLFLFISNMPSLLAALLFWFIPESPKFLMTQGRSEEALNVFRTIYARNTGKPRASYPVKSLMPGLTREADAEGKRSIGDTLRLGWQLATQLLKPPLLKTALVIFFLQSLTLMSMNVIRLLQPEILSKFFSQHDSSLSLCESISRHTNAGPALSAKQFRVQFHATAPELHTAHETVIRSQLKLTSLDNYTTAPVFNSDKNMGFSTAEERHRYCKKIANVDMRIYSVTAYMGVFSFLYYIMTVFLVRGLSKKNLFLFAMFMCTLCMGVYPWSYSVYVVLLAGVYLAFMFTTNNLVLGCSLQAFPTTTRAMAVNLTMMFGRSGTIVGSLMFPKFIEEKCHAAFLTLSAICIVCGVVCLWLLTEVAYEEKSISRPVSAEEMAEDRAMSHSMFMIHN